jgi:hypothetical protein
VDESIAYVRTRHLVSIVERSSEVVDPCRVDWKCVDVERDDELGSREQEPDVQGQLVADVVGQSDPFHSWVPRKKGPRFIRRMVVYDENPGTRWGVELHGAQGDFEKVATVPVDDDDGRHTRGDPPESQTSLGLDPQWSLEDLVLHDRPIELRGAQPPTKAGARCLHRSSRHTLCIHADVLASAAIIRPGRASWLLRTSNLRALSIRGAPSFRPASWALTAITRG